MAGKRKRKGGRIPDIPSGIQLRMQGELRELRKKYPSYRDDEILFYELCKAQKRLP